MVAWRKEFDTPAKCLWSKVDTLGGPDACWPWTGSRRRKGYGQFRYGDLCSSSHVFAFVLKNGYRPPVVRHSCDNPPCCNPRYLLGGTDQDNKDDMVRRGRSCTGEISHAAKLTEKKVRKIREQHIPQHSRFGARALARKFGVSHVAILRIIQGSAWRHV